jgi:hypothetical protein
VLLLTINKTSRLTYYLKYKPAACGYEADVSRIFGLLEIRSKLRFLTHEVMVKDDARNFDVLVLGWWQEDREVDEWQEFHLKSES